MGIDVATDKVIETGIKEFASVAGATGTIRLLDSPDEVLDFIDGPDVPSTVVISRAARRPSCPRRSCPAWRV